MLLSGENTRSNNPTYLMLIVFCMIMIGFVFLSGKMLDHYNAKQLQTEQQNAQK